MGRCSFRFLKRVWADYRMVIVCGVTGAGPILVASPIEAEAGPVAGTGSFSQALRMNRTGRTKNNQATIRTHGLYRPTHRRSQHAGDVARYLDNSELSTKAARY